MGRFCDVVKAARKAKGLTLEKVAKAIKSHKGYVSGFENDKVSPPSAPIVVRLAKMLDLDVEELLVLRLLEKRGRLLTVRKVHQICGRILEEDAKRISEETTGVGRKEVGAREPAVATA